jgi:hypothetical protein
MSAWITGLTQKIEGWASGTGAIYKLAAGYYRDVIEKEVVLANITKDDHILCIGGGICPFSAILLHQMTGAKVTVIDNNEICISRAREVIGRLGLNKMLRVLCRDGGSDASSFQDYTVIHFALQVCPMTEVFSHAESRAAAGTRMLVRRPKRGLAKI